MKNKTIINYFMLGLLILVFFFQIIPIPVENIFGSNLPDKFIFGVFYYTSILYQLSVKNYFGSGCLTSIFIILFWANNIINKGEKNNEYKK